MNVNGKPDVSESDFLTEILKASPLSIRFAGRLNWTAPCGIDLPEGFGAICCVAQGQCYVGSAHSAELTQAGAGDVFVLSPAVGHRLQYASDNPSGPAPNLLELLRPGSRVISVPRSGEPWSVLIGGFFEFNGVGTCPLHWILPPVVHLRRNGTGEASDLETMIHLVVQELTRGGPGQKGIVNRLVEVLLIRILQSSSIDADPLCEETIHGLLHRDLATTLALVHREPAKPWTVAALADQAAMSRSNFSATFLKVLGKPPLQYVRDYRMQLACRLLRNQSLGLKEIASQVGYDSTSAFSAAFKRVMGTHPSGYRRRETKDASSR